MSTWTVTEVVDHYCECSLCRKEKLVFFINEAGEKLHFSYPVASLLPQIGDHYLDLPSYSMKPVPKAMIEVEL